MPGLLAFACRCEHCDSPPRMPFVIIKIISLSVRRSSWTPVVYSIVLQASPAAVKYHAGSSWYVCIHKFRKFSITSAKSKTSDLLYSVCTLSCCWYGTCSILCLHVRSLVLIYRCGWVYCKTSLLLEVMLHGICQYYPYNRRDKHPFLKEDPIARSGSALTYGQIDHALSPH